MRHYLMPLLLLFTVSLHAQRKEGAAEPVKTTEKKAKEKNQKCCSESPVIMPINLTGG
jgi:hypothetical protein